MDYFEVKSLGLQIFEDKLFLFLKPQALKFSTPNYSLIFGACELHWEEGDALKLV